MELNYFNYSVIQFLNIFLFVIIYSTVYSPVFFLTNSVEGSSTLYALSKTIVTQISLLQL